MTSRRQYVWLTFVVIALSLIRPASAFVTPRSSASQRVPSLPLFDTTPREPQPTDSSRLPASNGSLDKRGPRALINYVADKLGYFSATLIRQVRRGYKTRLAQRIRKVGIAAVLFLSILWINLTSAGAVTGGRMGGSFGSSRSSGGWGGGGGYHTPHRIVHYDSPSSYYMRHPSPYRPSTSLQEQPYATQYLERSNGLLSVGEVAIALAVPYAVSRGLYESFVADTAKVITLTIALKVKDRNAPNNIMTKMKKLSQTCDTSDRAGVLDMLKQTADMLKQQQPLITSASLSLSPKLSGTEGEREFHRRSTLERTKLDLEAINRYGALVAMEADITDDDTVSEAPDKDDGGTVAVVAITISHHGAYELPSDKLLNREDLRGHLTTIANIQEEALLAGEVVWAPATSDEYVPEDYLYRNYPDLVPM